jgi:hypothetical protein
MARKKLISNFFAATLALLVFLCSTSLSAQNAYYLWPTVLFVKGQDLCQFQEGFGASRKEQVNEMASQLKDLMRYGASTQEGMQALFNLDGMVDKNRHMPWPRHAWM